MLHVIDNYTNKCQYVSEDSCLKTQYLTELFYTAQPQVMITHADPLLLSHM